MDIRERNQKDYSIFYREKILHNFRKKYKLGKFLSFKMSNFWKQHTLRGITWEQVELNYGFLGLTEVKECGIYTYMINNHYSNALSTPHWPLPWK